PPATEPQQPRSAVDWTHPRRGTEHGSGLGTQRWVVERAFAHLHWFRRLRIRWEIRDDIHEAFLTLGCALICWRRITAV
ncbi:transposase, partial [Streptomyces sp. NPDC058832]|uniref:transposase n=1 Tax=Streptomyces sp. NPDC058832 TaxID=3346646 RepID=UPI0036B426AB